MIFIRGEVLRKGDVLSGNVTASVGTAVLRPESRVVPSGRGKGEHLQIRIGLTNCPMDPAVLMPAHVS